MPIKPLPMIECYVMYKLNISHFKNGEIFREHQRQFNTIKSTKIEVRNIHLGYAWFFDEKRKINYIVGLSLWRVVLLFEETLNLNKVLKHFCWNGIHTIHQVNTYVGCYCESVRQSFGDNDQVALLALNTHPLVLLNYFIMFLKQDYLSQRKSRMTYIVRRKIL